MGLRHLQVVLTVAEAGSISRAATSLKIAQSGLTAQLRRIEQGFGGPLFQRRPDGVRPTELGTHVVLRARELVDQFDELISTARMLVRQDRPASMIRLGGVDSPFIPRIAAVVRDLLPGREQATHLADSSEAALELLRAGKLDLAVLTDYSGVPAPPVDDLAAYALGTEPMYVGMAADHPLADREKVELAELAHDDWIAPPDRADGLRLSLRLACEQAGFTPRFRHFGTDHTAAAALVMLGNAVGVFTPCPHQPAELLLKPLVGEPLWGRARMVWSPDSPVAGLADDIRAALTGS